MADVKLVRGRVVVADPELLPDAGFVEHGAVAIEGATVAAVGEYEELHRSYPRATEIGSEAHIVVPGLVNAHHHGQGLTSLQLGLADGYLEPWMAAFWAGIRPLDVYLDTLFSDTRLLRSGVTTVLHMAYAHDWGEAPSETLAALRAHEESGLRVAYGLPVSDRNSFVYDSDERFLAGLPPELAARTQAALAEVAPLSSDTALDLFASLVARYAGHPRIRLLLSPTGPQWCSDGLLRRLRAAADEHGTDLHLHCLESPFQREFARRTHGKGAVEHLHELGILGPDVSLAHAIWLTEREIDLCAETGTSVCHNASSNLRLRVGVQPTTRMLERGVNVAVGTDGMALNDDEDLLQELRLVATLHRLPQGLAHRGCLDAADVVRMATVNGARATGFEGRIGALKAGLGADLVLLDHDSLAWPYLDPRVGVAAALVGRACARHVDTVLVAGEVLVAGGRLTRIDEEALAAELRAVAEAGLAPRAARFMAAMDELRPYVERFYTGWDEPLYQPLYTVNSLV